MPKDDEKLPLAKAAHESDWSKERILSAVRDGDLTEYPGRRYSLNEIRALQSLPTIRQMRRRVTR
jgi:hypothetical protein